MIDLIAVYDSYLSNDDFSNFYVLVSNAWVFTQLSFWVIWSSHFYFLSSSFSLLFAFDKRLSHVSVYLVFDQFDLHPCCCTYELSWCLGLLDLTTRFVSLCLLLRFPDPKRISELSSSELLFKFVNSISYALTTYLPS